MWYDKSYPNVKLQTNKYSYAFSDFPHSIKTNLYPSREELIIYFNKYCLKHDIINNCKFNCKVINIIFNKNKNKWKIIYINNKKKYIYVCDHIIIASGLYTSLNKKLISDNMINSKKIYYPEDFSYKKKCNLNILNNKTIVIIGNGPSGCDLSVLAYKHKAKKIILLYRSKRWIFKRYLWNKLSTDFLLSRFFLTIANNIPTLIYKISIYIGFILVYMFSQGIFTTKLLPPFDLITRNNLVLNENLANLIFYNKINYVQANNIKITNNNIFYNNCSINYDICILATGYKNNIKFLNLNKIPLLYKKIIHPNIKNCGFIGFAASFNWIKISELQINWYLNYIKKKPKSKEIMINYIKKNIHKNYNYYDLAVKTYSYCDKITKDISLKNKYSIYNYKYWFFPLNYIT